MKTIIIAVFLLSTLRLSAQSGILWSEPVDVAPRTAGNLHPRICLDGSGNPLVIWGHSGTSRVLFARWNGSSFTNQTVVNPIYSPAFYEYWAGPDIASRGDTVYIAYKQTPEATNHTYCIRSFDAGRSFSAPVIVDQIADSISRFAALTIDESGNPIVAFMKFDKNFRNSRWVVCRSTDLGTSFSKDALASGYSGGAVCDCCPGTIIASENTVTMLYRDDYQDIRDTWVGVSRDNGQSFAASMEVDKQKWKINYCPASGPDGTIIGDTLYSVFMSGANGETRVYHNQNCLSTLQSSTAKAIAPEFKNINAQNYPRIASYQFSVAEVWQQNSNAGSQIAMRFASDVRKGFDTKSEVILDGKVAQFVNVDLALYNGSIYVVYQDDNTGMVRMRQGTFRTSSTETVDMTSEALVYPQPTPDGTLQLRVGPGFAPRVHVVVYSSLGEEVWNSLMNISNDVLQLSVSQLPTGSYQVLCTNGSRNKVFAINKD